MSKIAIVGVKGSGKTVLMSVLGEKYQVADADGLVMLPENADAFSFVRVNMAKMRNGGWPMETPHDSMRAMRWSLQRERDDGPNKVFCDLDFLDFGGEIYTDAFGSGPTAKSDMWANEREALKQHIDSSQMLVVLVNLRDVVSGATDPDTLSALWVTKGILDYARRDLQLENLAIAFTQVDAYREVIDSCGGLQGVLKKYVPHIYSGYRDLPLFALSAVDKTIEDKDGLLVPAPGFGSQGLDELVHWILGNTEEGIPDAGEIAARRQRPHVLWRELVAGMEALSADAAQPTGLSAAERLAKVNALQGMAAELAVNGLRHTVPDFTDENLVERRMELESWAKLAGMANEYVKAVAEKRGAFAAQLEASLASEGMAQPLLLARVREETRQIRAEQKRGVVKRVMVAAGLVAAAVVAVVAAKNHNAEVDRLVAEKGYSCTMCLGVKIAAWKAGVRHPHCSDLVTATEIERWVSTKRGYKWDGENGVEPSQLKAGDTWAVQLPGGATMEMVWCPAGSFMMGSPTREEYRHSDETQHRVTLTQGFWMGKYEVTQAQWESVMGSNPSNSKGANRPVEQVPWDDCQDFIRTNSKGANRPVEQVSWDDCQDFIRKVNAAGQVTVALPTEAQWEYACRAGTGTPFSFGTTLNGDKANCDGDYPYGTSVKGRYREEISDVGTYAPNAWGLYDMHGNVWEWCSDWKGDYAGDAIDPTGPASGTLRVLRGGSWLSSARNCRSALRSWCEPGYRDYSLGFRLVCSLP